MLIYIDVTEGQITDVGGVEFHLDPSEGPFRFVPAIVEGVLASMEIEKEEIPRYTRIRWTKSRCELLPNF